MFLNELGGNPNKRNGRNETALLCVCMVPSARLNYAIQQRRLECLSLVLQWRGATLENGEVERVDLSAQDEVSWGMDFYEIGDFDSVRN